MSDPAPAAERPPSQVAAWLLASRPKTLPAAIVPVVAGCALVHELTGNYSLYLAVLTLVAAIAIQIATNFYNDVLDADKGADTAARKGPARMISSGRLSRKAVMGAALGVLVVAAICGGLLIHERGWIVLAIGLPSLYLSYGYTGGPFPLAYLGLGELFVILFFGLVAVGGTVFVQTGELLSGSLVLGLQIGFLSAILIGVNNYRDVAEDAAAGKNTLAVRLGRPLFGGILLAMVFAVPTLFFGYEQALFDRWVVWWIGSMVLAFWHFNLIGLRLVSTGFRGDFPNAFLGLSALHLVLFMVFQLVAYSLT